MQTLGKHFQTLTREAFSRHGFAQGDLLANWASIVGDDLAAHCQPEKIKWPYGMDAKTGGGTLHLRAAPGRALDIQYQIPRLLQRVNQFFGYDAVRAAKVSAMPDFKPAPAARPVMPPPDPQLLEKLAPVADEGLRLALARLGTNIVATARSPQPK